MPRCRRFPTVPVLLCFFLVSVGAIAAGISGCGGSITRDYPPPELPADAVYDSSVRSVGYTITDLGPGKVTAINRNGDVLGGTSYAYVWSKGKRRYLGKLAADKGGNEASTLSDNGQALGISYSEVRTAEGLSGENHPFVWQNGVFTRIFVEGSSDSLRAVTLNNAGQVLVEKGYSSDTTFYLWRDGQSVPVSANGIGGNPLYLRSINNNGVILGSAFDSAGPFFETPVNGRTYLIRDGQTTDIGFLPNRLNTQATFLNDREQIVGVGFSLNQNDTDNPPLYYVWQNGVLSALTGLSITQNLTALNNEGKATGWANDVRNETTVRGYAFLYDLNTQTQVDLDTTVGKPAGWQLYSADGINDAGQIIGEGKHNGEQRSFLLTPLL